MSASVTVPLTRCDLHMWGFTAVPDEACVECHTCNAKYSMDKLRRVAVYHANSCNTAQVNVYCCIRPLVPESVSVNRLSCHYGVNCSADRATPEQPAPQPNDAEREPAVCRWCKGKRETTVNFKTKPCDCVKQEDTDHARREDIDYMYNATFGRLGVKKTGATRA